LKFIDALKLRTLVSDGAMGTMLQENGLNAGHCPEEWNISHPNVISTIYKNYYEAGADIVETNTFGGNLYRLKHNGFEDRIYEFNKAGAEIAKSVCPEGKFVAGSVGPTGEFLQPLGLATISDLENAFEEQIQGLIDGGVDVLFIETMSYTEEINAAVSAAQKIDKYMPLVTSMSIEKSAVGYRTLMGITISEFVEKTINLPISAIGANCGKGPEEMVEIMEEFRNHTDLPLLAQANAGLPETIDDKMIYNETLEQRGELTQILLNRNVNIIGGCCGTNPNHIKAIRNAVDKYSSLK